MRCEEVRDRLVEYLDGGGTSGGRGIADHLAGCAACRGEYEALRDTLRLVKEVRESDPGAAFWRENRDAIRTAVARAGGPRARRGLWRLPAVFRPGIPAIGRPSAVLLTALIVLSGLFALRDSRVPRPGDATDGISAPDRAILGEAYLEGVLFPGDRPADELAWLSAADLADLVRAMGGRVDGGHARPSGDEWNGYGWGGVEEEIRGLDPEQLDRLMELLATPPARG